ncbi:hypothetical protein BGY98DRAFT_1013791 [Russula aff. rugulosa BPL654]|nr:hypothetical protein BGY98DRAFT_1013791 [Russula aff. rugulosa BPL654]
MYLRRPSCSLRRAWHRTTSFYNQSPGFYFPAMLIIIWSNSDLLLHNLALIISILPGLARATLPCYSGVVQTV